MPPFAKLKGLVDKAKQWLGLAEPVMHTTTVAGDRFDEMTWRETFEQATALQDLTDELADRYDYVGDLMHDLFLGAYKAAPQIRDRDELDPRRHLNHQIVTTALDTPEWEELRRATVGDPYASAMAMLAFGEKLKSILEQTKTAQDAADAAAAAQAAAAAAAAEVEQAVQGAQGQADEDGNVPAAAAEAVEAAVASAEAASQAAAAAGQAAGETLAAAGTTIRAAMRTAANAAAEAAREEAELMMAWGVDPGQLQRMPFEQRRRLAERLRGNRLGQFAKLIGRFKRMAEGERARRTQYGQEELVGVTTGDDLGKLIPSEVAALGIPAARAGFVARLVEQRLFVYETQGEEVVGKGAIIVAIDCSGSMESKAAGGVTREAWAKACGLALLDQARVGRRDFAAILFGSATEIKTFYFPKGQSSVDQVIDFAEFFFGGGTDFEAPLDEAIGILQGQYDDADLRHGDVVFITDGYCVVSDEWMANYNQRKATLGFRTFGVVIDSPLSPALKAAADTPTLEGLADNVRSVSDLVDVDQTRDLFRAI